MATFYIKKNDTAPNISTQFIDADTGLPVDLTSATGVTFRMVLTGNEGLDTPKVNTAGTIDDAVNGIVSYAWQAGDTDTAGVYSAEWRVAYTGGGQGTYPRGRPQFDRVIVQEDA